VRWALTGRESGGGLIDLSRFLVAASLASRSCSIALRFIPKNPVLVHPGLPLLFVLLTAPGWSVSARMEAAFGSFFSFADGASAMDNAIAFFRSSSSDSVEDISKENVSLQPWFSEVVGSVRALLGLQRTVDDSCSTRPNGEELIMGLIEPLRSDTIRGKAEERANPRRG